MVDYREVATRLLAENINAAPSEVLLVMIDTDTNRIGWALFGAGVDLGPDSGLFEIPPMERNRMKPPESVARAMESADVVVYPTSTPPAHTRAREAAAEAGARVATMPGITDRMSSAGAITADYGEVERLTAAFTEKLTAADETHIEAGSASATMSLSSCDGIPSDDIIADPDDSGNFPSDESYVTPVERTATGTLVFGGGLAGVSVLDDPLTVELSAGHITSVEGTAADEFLDATSGNDYARRVCELGFGTSPVASIIGTVFKDEKVYDACHVASGDNLGSGGTVGCDSYLDGAILEPAVSPDGNVVVADDEVRV